MTQEPGSVSLGNKKGIEALARQDCRQRGRRKRLAEDPLFIPKVYLTL